jgi:serine/threonine-protein kinase
MGEIFLARLEGAEGFEKLYVVKRILAHLADDMRFRQMLIAEARIASKMSHPNICQVFELGDSEGQLYIVMEYLEGVSLLPLLRRFSKNQQQLELGFIAGVMQQVTDAMNYAHELKDRDGQYLGIIHRDVTPSNIFVTESGVAKVLDFGIAKARGASTQTQEGTVKGKYAYMAPEQLKGAGIDRRVDVFAMGVVLYEMLALRRLFQRKTDYLTFRAVMEQPIPDIRRYRPDLPDGVAAALTRALERDPNDRFETARQFGSAVLDGMSQYTRPWTQGEVSDMLRHYFAEEIGKRHAQVATVVNRNPGVSKRATMPLFSMPDEETHVDDAEDTEFPSVETDVEGAPPWMPRPASPAPNPMGPQNTTEFQGHSSSGTPPPFGVETTGSAPMLQPLRGSPVMPPSANTPPIVMVPQRDRGRCAVPRLEADAEPAAAGGDQDHAGEHRQADPIGLRRDRARDGSNQHDRGQLGRGTRLGDGARLGEESEDRAGAEHRGEGQAAKDLRRSRGPAPERPQRVRESAPRCHAEGRDEREDHRRGDGCCEGCPHPT